MPARFTSAYSQHPDPTHVIAHLSDPHLLADRLLYDTIDSAANLERVLARLSLIQPAPQALVFTGDLADEAEPQAYERLRQIVEPAAAAMGAQVIWVMGNHDERAEYSAALFGAASDEPQDRVHDVAGVRVVALDTTVPGYHHGALEDSQLAWLANVLATPAPHGTILAMHHPPIPVPAVPVAGLIELDDQERLAEVIHGTDVRAVIGGHFHFTSYSTFAGVPVSVAGASCYSLDTAPSAVMSGVDANQSITLMHVYPDRIVHSVVPMIGEPEVAGYTREQLQALNQLMPEQQREMASNKNSPLNRPTPH